MIEIFQNPFLFTIYIVLSMVVSFFLTKKIGQLLFTLLNISFVPLLLFWTGGSEENSKYIPVTILVFSVLQWLAMRFFSKSWRWIPLLLPALFLISSRILPHFLFSDYATWFGSWSVPVLAQSGLARVIGIVGLSYVCFRMILTAVEIQGEQYPLPSLWRYHS
ncbi:MAG: hypothetical protein AB7O96_05250, partial [Pseudobdellovibrionaceae bacterium]